MIINDPSRIADPPPCPHCGACVICGPPCCDGMEADVRAYKQSPEYQEIVRKQREEGLARKRANKLAKRQRREAKLAAKAWDSYDQFLADQAAWEGLNPQEHKHEHTYTADSIRAAIHQSTKWDIYIARLAVGQSPTWICDQRTADLFCLSQWLIEELTAIGLSDDDRKAQQRFFNRKSRATDDLYQLAAQTINDALRGNIDTYRGRG
jgi:hypothetical protein